jgi:hypothetical protein
MSYDGFIYDGNYDLFKQRPQSRNYHYRLNNNFKDQENVKLYEGILMVN